MDNKQDTVIRLFKEGLSVNRISVIQSISGFRIKKILEQAGIKFVARKHRRYSLDESFFYFINTEEKAYWLGFLYADGCIYKNNINILLKGDGASLDHLQKYKKSLKSNHTIEIREEKIRDPLTKKIVRLQNTVKVRIYCPKMAEDLIRHGCTPRKTFTLQFPSELTVPAQFIRHFIRGYFDGDGSIWFSDSNPKYRKWGLHFTGTDAFIEKVQETFTSILRASSKNYMAPHATSAGISILTYSSISDINKIKEYLYDGASIFFSPKKEKFDLLPYKEFRSTSERLLVTIPEYLSRNKREFTSKELSEEFLAPLLSTQVTVFRLAKQGKIRISRSEGRKLFYVGI